jgi:cyclic beta-1,2-glucan synthetase
MMRVAMESLLGVRMVGGREITVAPCVPDEWPDFAVTMRVPGEDTCYELKIVNPHQCARRIVSAEVDGVALGVDGNPLRVPIVHDGRTHRVNIVLGAQVARA